LINLHVVSSHNKEFVTLSSNEQTDHPKELSNIPAGKPLIHLEGVPLHLVQRTVVLSKNPTDLSHWIPNTTFMSRTVTSLKVTTLTKHPSESFEGGEGTEKEEDKDFKEAPEQPEPPEQSTPVATTSAALPPRNLFTYNSTPEPCYQIMTQTRRKYSLCSPS
jgi:hypothetical protein